MASSTTQVTHEIPNYAMQPAYLHISLTNRAENVDSSSPISKEKILELAQIIRDCEEYNDELSKKLFKWCAQLVLAEEIEGVEEEISPEFLSNEFQRMLDKLNRILKNRYPLGPKILTDPVLEREYLWERSLLKKYKTEFTLSPFDFQPMQEPVDHVFAKRVIDWKNSLPMQFLPAEPSMSLVPRDGQHMDLAALEGSNSEMQTAIILQTASLALANHNNRLLRQQMKMVIKGADRALEQGLEWSQLQAQAALQRQMEHEERLSAQIQSYRETNDAEKNLLRSELAEEVKQRQLIKEDLKRQEDETKKLGNEAQNLRESMKKKEEEHNNKIVSLHKEIAKEAVDEIKKTHLADMESKKRDLDAKEQRIRKLEVVVTKSRQEISSRDIRISSLDSRLHTLEQQNAENTKKAKKGGRCEVM